MSDLQHQVTQDIPDTRLSAAVREVDTAGTDIAMIANRVENMVDKLRGDQPKESTEPELPVRTGGLMGDLEYNNAQLNHHIARLTGAFHQLEKQV